MLAVAFLRVCRCSFPGPHSIHVGTKPLDLVDEAMNGLLVRGKRGLCHDGVLSQASTARLEILPHDDGPFGTQRYGEAFGDLPIGVGLDDLGQLLRFRFAQLVALGGSARAEWPC